MDNRERFAQEQDALRAALTGERANLWTSLPGYVVSFDPEAVTVVVQPGIKGIVRQPDGGAEAVDLPELPDVPVLFQRGGGVTLTFPIKPGDEAMVWFSSRCIDGWWQSGGSQLAPEFRMHDLSDGFAMVGPQSQANKISGISTATAQMRSDDGQAFIEINPTSHEIRTKTVGDVVGEVGGDVTATIAGTMTGVASAWNITGPVNINGPLNVTGGMTASGVIESASDVKSGGVSLQNHEHPGDDSGGGTTGGPIK